MAGIKAECAFRCQSELILLTIRLHKLSTDIVLAPVSAGLEGDYDPLKGICLLKHSRSRLL